MTARALVCLLLALASAPCRADDRLLLADGTEVSGRYESLDAGSVRFAPTGEESRGYPLAEVARVLVETPPGLARMIETARSQVSSGQKDLGLRLLGSTVEEGKDHGFVVATALFQLQADSGDLAGASKTLAAIPRAFLGDEAAARAERLRADLLERRRSAFQSSRSAADRGDYEGALRHLEKYLAEAVLAEEEGADPRAAVLEALDRLYWEWGQVAAGSGGAPQPFTCAKCSGALVVQCPACEGKGKVTKTIRPRQDLSTGRYIPGKTVDVDCPTCNKVLKVPCDDCKGSGIAVDSLPSAQRNSIVRLVQTLTSSTGALKKDEAASALEKLAGASRAVEVPGNLEVRYPTGKALRDLFGPDPTVRPAAVDLQKAWAAASETDRLGFLVGLALELALARDRVLRFGPEAAATPESAAAGPMALREASAQLRALDDKKVKVVGVLRVVADREGCPFARGIALEGDSALSVHYYPPAGIAWLRRLADADLVRSAGLAQLLGSYPADPLEAKVKALAPGDQVELEGRLRFRPGASPIGILEVWDVRSLGRPVAANPGEGEPPKEDPKPEPPRREEQPPPENPRPEPPRRNLEFPPELAGRPAGELAEEGRSHLARAQKEFLASGATQAARSALLVARDHFAAALAADPENAYLADALSDVEEFTARLEGR